MSGFNINITAGGTPETSSVSVSGKEQHIITGEERNTFQLNDYQLKKAVETYFGKSPNDAYLCSPTPWGDLYQTYNWEQTETNITCASAEIVSFEANPIIVKQQTFTNESSHTGEFTVSISDSVTQSTTTSWETGGDFTVGQTFKYEIGFLGTGGGGETSMSYTQSWGKGGSETKAVTIGSTAGVTVTLEPGESVIASLSASRGVMTVKIRYQSVLTGMTAVNYNPTYKGHHFWGLGLPSVMSSAGISNKIISEETIKVDYYSNGQVELLDPGKKKAPVKYTALVDVKGYGGSK